MLLYLGAVTMSFHYSVHHQRVLQMDLTGRLTAHLFRRQPEPAILRLIDRNLVDWNLALTKKVVTARKRTDV
jgi:hypothetical protein